MRSTSKKEITSSSVQVYELDRIDFAESYLVACAESSAIRQVASFDRPIDRVKTIKRIEPPRLRS